MEANLTRAVPEVTVIFTTPDATIAALRVAAMLGRAWNAPIRLIAQQPPTYAVPQDGPAVGNPVESPAFRARLAREIDARVEVLVCVTRRIADLARALLRRGSLVVIGGRQRLVADAAGALATGARGAGVYRRARQRGGTCGLIASASRQPCP